MTARGGRAGVGPAGTIADLPASWAQARQALRLTAEGTPADPGPRVVVAAEVEALLLLARTVHPGTRPGPDVEALERAAAAAAWVLPTLDAVCTTTSRRSAAAKLAVHHSSLQERLHTAERLLGWDLLQPAGVLRLQLALVGRRLHRTPL